MGVPNDQSEEHTPTCNEAASIRFDREIERGLQCVHKFCSRARPKFIATIQIRIYSTKKWLASKDDKGSQRT